MLIYMGQKFYVYLYPACFRKKNKAACGYILNTVRKYRFEVSKFLKIKQGKINKRYQEKGSYRCRVFYICY